MISILSECDTTELMTVLSSKYVLDVCGGAGTVITESLPGKAVCAIREEDGHVYFFVDVEKPMAYRHARQMIREWQAAKLDAPVDLVPSSPEPQGPCLLSRVS